MDKIQRPARIGPGLDQDRCPGSYRLGPGPACAHREPFFSIQPVDTVDPGVFSLSALQQIRPSIAEPAAFIGQCPKPLAQSGLGRSQRPVMDHLAVRRSDRPSLACKCATALGFTAGPKFFLGTVPSSPQRRPSAPPVTSPAWRSRMPAPSVA